MMLTDEQIQIAVDWWGSELSHDLEGIRDPFCGALFGRIKAESDQCRKRGLGLTPGSYWEIYLFMDHACPGPILLSSLYEGGLERSRKGLDQVGSAFPKFTTLSMGSNGRVWTRKGNGGKVVLLKGSPE